ncbi:NAD-dependent epimerase/dehydratase family protein [Sphingomonas sp. TX0543]|uniref:NAD-dependent epimerase/dehydratase family protein n=1 Tax=unclassified Sphingomonas TaxID=196159 RepID=UPI001BB19A4F|nr:NAD-dependent epimerase/dehydratase family protein [Sphingomonas sp. 3P27F8]
MKIMVTGGLGFIGQALGKKLQELGHEVVLVDSLTPQIHGALPVVIPPAGADVVRLDVRDLARHSELVDGCDAIYHLAAETGTAQSMYRVQDYVAVNELGTAALIEAIASADRKPGRVILASSRSVYGEGAYVAPDRPDMLVQPMPRSPAQLADNLWEPRSANGTPLTAVPTPEDLPFSPGSIYAATKASQELLLRAAGPALGFKPVIFRFQNVYGEGQSLQNPYTGIISIFFNRARQGMTIPVYEDGLESRDFIHIEDIVDGLVAALDADLPDGATMNLGAGAPTTVLDLVDQLLKSGGFRVPVQVTGQYRVGDIRHCFADLTRARSLLGFEPRVTLVEGLTRFCAWAGEQPVHEDRLEQAAAELRARKLMGA